MFKKSLFVLTIAALSTYGLSAKEGKDAVHKPATEGAEPGKWTQDYDAAIKMAAEKGLPLMLNFTGSDWCGWCKIMDKNVFADEKDWGPYAKENLMLVTLDFPKDKSIVPEKWVHRNEKLKDKFGVRGFPTYVVLDSNGESKLGQLGASREATPKSFVQQAKGVLRFSKSAIAAFTAKLSEEKASEYKGLLSAHKKSKKALADWLETRPKRNDENMAKFKKFNENIASSMAKIESFE